MRLNSGVGEDSRESLGLQGDQTSQPWRKSVLGVHWRDWCWSWNSSTLASWFEELTHWKRPWCWQRLKAGGEGDDRGWDGWMESPTQWTWVWEASGVGDGQGSLVCCSPWGHKEPDMTESLYLLIFHAWSWESQFLGRLIRSPTFPRRKRGSGALEKKKGVWGSQGEKDRCSFLHCFVLVNITVYLAQGYVSP